MNIVVVGGGTATNAIAPLFPLVASTVVYVVPISDNGGSTSEILRVLGGPAIGDARSRLVRLMPPSGLRDLLGLRLPEDGAAAAASWSQIVQGEHSGWTSVPSHLKHMYRAFFIHVAAEITKRRRPGNAFRFSNASVGNLLLSGARIFFGSLDSAIEFVLRTSRVPDNIAVLPALNTNFSHHIAAELTDGSVVVGQTEISHPGAAWMQSKVGRLDDDDTMEDANMPFSHPSLSTSQLSFSKIAQPLPAPVDRIYYVNPYGAEIKPRCSQRVLSAVSAAEAVIFSVGSLYTSILPVIVLQGFARELMAARTKVLLLNGSTDRETFGMDAFQYLQAVIDGCYYSLGASGGGHGADWSQFITHLIYISPAPEGSLRVDRERIERRGVVCVPVPGSGYVYSDETLAECLAMVLGAVSQPS